MRLGRLWVAKKKHPSVGKPSQKLWTSHRRDWRLWRFNWIELVSKYFSWLSLVKQFNTPLWCGKWTFKISERSTQNSTKSPILKKVSEERKVAFWIKFKHRLVAQTCDKLDIFAQCSAHLCLNYCIAESSQQLNLSSVHEISVECHLYVSL